MAGSIVCGVDDSGTAAAVLATADWLAARLDAEVVALHAVEPAGGGHHRGMRILEEAVDEVQPQRPPDLRVCQDDPSEQLIAVAGGEDAMLTVVGSSGHGSLRRRLAGSVSHELVKSLRRPVVVVPSGASVPGRAAHGPLLCGVDASEGSDRAVALASALARALERRLLIVHAYAPAPSVATIPAGSGITVAQSEQLQKMAECDASRVLERAAAVAGTRTEVQGRLVVGDAAEQLADIAFRECAPMIVVGSRGRGPLASAVFGSVASALMDDARVPVLIAADGAYSPDRLFCRPASRIADNRT